MPASIRTLSCAKWCVPNSGLSSTAGRDLGFSSVKRAFRASSILERKLAVPDTPKIWFVTRGRSKWYLCACLTSHRLACFLHEVRTCTCVYTLHFVLTAAVFELRIQPCASRKQKQETPLKQNTPLACISPWCHILHTIVILHAGLVYRSPT